MQTRRLSRMSRAISEQSPAEDEIQKSDGSPAAPRRSERTSRFRVYAVVGPLFMLLLLWFWGFRAEGAFKGGPDGRAFEGDYAMFVSAAHILQQGGNPYDTRVLFHEERARLQREHLQMTRHTAVIRVGNPPLIFWAMEPFTPVRYQPAALAWGSLLLLATVIGFVGVLIYARWNRLVLATVLFLLFPQAYFGAFYGNVVPLVFLGVGLALAVLRRHPLAAGALLTFTLLKPPVALFIVLLVFLFHPAQRKRLAVGFFAGVAALALATAAATGWHALVWWSTGLVGYANNIQSTPDVASLGGLYIRWAPQSLRTVFQALSLAVALAATGAWWLKNRHTDEPDRLSFALLWLVWSLAAPYAHFYDEMLLAVPMIIVLGHNGQRVGWRLPVICLYLLFVSAMVVSAEPFKVILLPFPMIGIAWCIWRAQRDSRYSEVSLARG